MSEAFIQFGDGPPVPIGRIEWARPKAEVPSERISLRGISDFSIEFEIPPQNAAAFCRAVGAPLLADRIEVETHPDLQELNVQVDGFYDGLEGAK